MDKAFGFLHWAIFMFMNSWSAHQNYYHPFDIVDSVSQIVLLK